MPIPRESIYKRYVPAITPVTETNDTAYWFVFCQNRLLVVAGSNSLGIPLISTPEELSLSPVRSQYLGMLEGHPCLASEVTPNTAAPQGMAYYDLRSLYGAIDEDFYLLAGRALQIMSWDQTHQYCGKCGHATEYVKDERAKKCPACGFASYPRLSPAVITAVLKGDEILLARYASFRGHMHTIIAGFVEPGETLEECLRREVFEETGIMVKNVRYFNSQPWPYPNSLMIGFIAEYESGEIHVDGKEIAEAGWYDVHSLPETPPKMSIAREIIDWFAEQYTGDTRLPGAKETA